MFTLTGKPELDTHSKLVIPWHGYAKSGTCTCKTRDPKPMGFPIPMPNPNQRQLCCLFDVNKKFFKKILSV